MGMADSDDNVATKADIADAVDELAGVTKQGLDDMQEQLGGLQGQIGNVLALVSSIDKQLAEHATHPKRIERLERTVFRRR